MTTEQLIEVMLYYLKNLNDQGVTPIDADTVFNTVLSETDGPGNATSKNIFKAFIRRSIKQRGLQDKPWPAEWFGMNANSLAPKLL